MRHVLSKLGDILFTAGNYLSLSVYRKTDTKHSTKQREREGEKEVERGKEEGRDRETEITQEREQPCIWISRALTTIVYSVKLNRPHLLFQGNPVKCSGSVGRH